MPVDAKGERVLTFQMSLQNAGRLGTYADLLIQMFTSKDWRTYSTALGVYEWRMREFDYFLISVGARHEDIVKLLQWKTVKAAKLVPAMTGDPGRQRRALSVASAAWKSPTGQSLIELAALGGWTRKDQPGTLLKGAPASERAKHIARLGTTYEEQASDRRKRRLSADERARLDRLVEEVMSRAGGADELRYVIERFRGELKRKNRWLGPSTPRRGSAAKFTRYSKRLRVV